MRQISLLGHRGARGLLPENTLPSLAKPFEYNAHGIEFDLQLSKDNHLVIYHDLRLKSNITRDTNGNWVGKPGPAVRSLTLKQLKSFKLGRLNKRSAYGMLFRKQRFLDDQTIPTLAELVTHFDQQGLNKTLLNIEIKHSPLDAQICPKPLTLAKKVIDEIHRLNIGSRVVISCFNWAVLKCVREYDRSLPIGCLTTIDPTEDTLSPQKGKPSLWNAGYDIRNYLGGPAQMVADFGADYWIPYYKNLTQQQTQLAHDHGLKVLTWTVNHKLIMKKLMNWDVDGLISDYPDKLQTAHQQWASKKNK